MLFETTVPKRWPAQWDHPFLEKNGPSHALSRPELEAFAYDYFLRFKPFFRNQLEGSLQPGVVIEFSRKMRQQLGHASLFENKIKLNETYFALVPKYLPYTLFHELVHLWLYHCKLDPSHTRRFYHKMSFFEATGLPIDSDVHIHKRMVAEAKYVAVCPGCDNRWYIRQKRGATTRYCGICYDNLGRKYYPVVQRNQSTNPMNMESS